MGDLLAVSLFGFPTDGRFSGCLTLFSLVPPISHRCPSETKVWGYPMHCSMPCNWSSGLDENSGLLTVFMKLRCSQNHLSEKMTSQNGAQEPRERGIFFLSATERMGSGPGKPLLQAHEILSPEFSKHSISATNLCRQACQPSPLPTSVCPAVTASNTASSHTALRHQKIPHSLTSPQLVIIAQGLSLTRTVLLLPRTVKQAGEVV